MALQKTIAVITQEPTTPAWNLSLRMRIIL
jgi:hypothetical protein